MSPINTDLSNIPLSPPETSTMLPPSLLSWSPVLLLRRVMKGGLKVYILDHRRGSRSRLPTLPSSTGGGVSRRVLIELDLAPFHDTDPSTGLPHRPGLEVTPQNFLRRFEDRP